MKAKNLTLALLATFLFFSCQKEETIITNIDDPEGTISNDLKCGHVRTSPVINFIGVEYTTNDNSVFQYSVKSGARPALSHWNLNIMPDLTGGGVNKVVLLRSSEWLTCYGPDGSLRKLGGGYCRLPWLKFDRPYCDGETRIVSFTLQGHWYVGDITCITKSGAIFIVSNIPGPVQVHVVAPAANTISVSNITNDGAEVSASVSAGTASDITERGTCWSTVSNPTIADAHSSDGTGAGEFTSILTELARNTTYYVRAYATTGQETVYGNEISFTTTNVR